MTEVVFVEGEWGTLRFGSHVPPLQSTLSDFY